MNARSVPDILIVVFQNLKITSKLHTLFNSKIILPNIVLMFHC